MAHTAWASVGWAEPGVLEIRVFGHVTSDASFAGFMADAERVYTAADAPFALVFRFDGFKGVTRRRATLWMQLFERVRPTTESKLVCTCVCSSSPAVLTGARLFTHFYSPIKPFRVFSEHAACLAEARTRLGAQTRPARG